ncbi:alpha-amylase [Streptomyces sp. NPDC101213]|uniref:alpha-amylase n=1 Tax=Streptomyces sp. NPDC101213 TaxID=3366130 RepID=UPI0038250B32
MPHLLARAAATAAAALTVLLASPAVSRAAIADPPGTPAPDCVHHYADRRHTTVVNDCDTTVSVTVDHADGQWAPCRTLAPHDVATFAGYGFGENRVTGLRTCLPGTV